MTAEASPEPPQLPLFRELVGQFSEVIQNRSNFVDIRNNPSYIQLVGMGDQAIGPILTSLDYPEGYTWEDSSSKTRRMPSRWLVLALDDITGQDISGLTELNGDVGAMCERALQWGERESHTAIRSDSELLRIGKELLQLTGHHIMSNSEGKDALANAFFVSDEESEERVATFALHGRKIEVKYGPNPNGSDTSLYLRATDPQSTINLGLLMWRYGSDSYADFWAPGGAVKGSYQAAEDFKKTLAQIFDPQQNQETQAA